MKTAATVSIEVRGQNGTVLFAASELQRYLRKMSPRVRFVEGSAGMSSCPGFILGLAQDAPEIVPPGRVSDPRDRDQLFILSQPGKILLAGNNPRSVLFAVYDFLERLGVRWLHPGPGGETIPRRASLPMSGWNVIETASFRYRGVDVEGAYTPRHAKAMVDWMAKKKMNHFFMQFENGAFWYRRMAPGLKVSEAIRWDREIMAEVKKRGLLLEWYGHGWNHNAIGKRIVGLDKAYKVPRDLKPLLAEVNGQRKWHNHYPLETQLCLTNPEVRAKVLRYFAHVVQRNPHVDILAFWLADGYNNQCECRRCRKFRMSELYAVYINEVAEIAHKMRPDLKIEVLVYMSTLEAPKRMPIKNPHGNLILMLAPLYRCYRHRLHDPKCAYPGKIPKFPVINKQPRLRNADFARFFAGWRKRYSGDTYLFDYHMLTLGYDFTGGNIPKMASADIKDIKTHGLDGYVGCQNLRCFWPSGLGMKVISETLWNVSKPYAAIREEHLREWFGPAAAAASAALDAMYTATGKSSPAHGRSLSSAQSNASREALLKAAKDLRGLKRRNDRGANRSANADGRNWTQRLAFLADHAEYLADQLVLSRPDSAEAEKAAARERLTRFFVKHAKDAEFLIDAQYHGKPFLARRPARKLTGEN